MIFVSLCLIFFSGVISADKDYYYSQQKGDNTNTPCENSENPCQTLDFVFSVINGTVPSSNINIHSLDSSTTILENKTELILENWSLNLDGSGGMNAINFSVGASLEITSKNTIISNFDISIFTSSDIENGVLKLNGQSFLRRCNVTGIRNSGKKEDRTNDQIHLMIASFVENCHFKNNQISDSKRISLIETSSIRDCFFWDNTGFENLVRISDLILTPQPSQIHLSNLIFQRNKVYSTLISLQSISQKSDYFFSAVKITQNECLSLSPTPITLISITSTSSNIFVQNANFTNNPRFSICFAVDSAPQFLVSQSHFRMCSAYLGQGVNTVKFNDFDNFHSPYPLTMNGKNIDLELNHVGMKFNRPNGALNIQSFRSFVCQDTDFFENINSNSHGGAIRISYDSSLAQTIEFPKGLTRTNIEGNKADRHYGGGIYFTGTPNDHTKVKISRQTKIHSNTAVYGGGIFLNFTISSKSTAHFNNSALVTRNTASTMGGGAFYYSFSLPPFPYELLLGEVIGNHGTSEQDYGGPPSSFEFYEEHPHDVGEMECWASEDDPENYLCEPSCVILSDIFGNGITVYDTFQFYFEEKSGARVPSSDRYFKNSCFHIQFPISGEDCVEGNLVLVVDKAYTLNSKKVELTYHHSGSKHKKDEHPDKSSFFEKNYLYFIDGFVVVLLCYCCVCCCGCCICFVVGSLKLAEIISGCLQRRKMKRFRYETRFSTTINGDEHGKGVSVSEIDPLLATRKDIANSETEDIERMFVDRCSLISLGRKNKSKATDREMLEFTMESIRKKAAAVLGSDFEDQLAVLSPIEIFQKLKGMKSREFDRKEYLRILFTFPGHEKLIISEIRRESEQQQQEDNIVNVKLDETNNRALHYACFFENSQYIRYLIDNGASVRAKNSMGLGRFPYQFLEKDNPFYEDVDFTDQNE